MVILYHYKLVKFAFPIMSVTKYMRFSNVREYKIKVKAFIDMKFVTVRMHYAIMFEICKCNTIK